MVVFRSCNTKRRRKNSWECKWIDRLKCRCFVILEGIGRIVIHAPVQAVAVMRRAVVCQPTLDTGRKEKGDARFFVCCAANNH